MGRLVCMVARSRRVTINLADVAQRPSLDEVLQPMVKEAEAARARRLQRVCSATIVDKFRSLLG